MGRLGENMQGAWIIDRKLTPFRLPPDQQHDDDTGERKAQDEVGGPDPGTESALGHKVFQQGADEP